MYVLPTKENCFNEDICKGFFCFFVGCGQDFFFFLRYNGKKYVYDLICLKITYQLYETNGVLQYGYLL